MRLVAYVRVSSHDRDDTIGNQTKAVRLGQGERAPRDRRVRRRGHQRETVRFYDLRYYHASWLVEHSAYNIEEIAKRLGHASTKMTLDRYVHADRESTRRKRGSLGSRRRPADNVRRLPA